MPRFKDCTGLCRQDFTVGLPAEQFARRFASLRGLWPGSRARQRYGSHTGQWSVVYLRVPKGGVLKLSNSCRKSLVASRDGDVSKPAANITMGRCFELKDDVNCRRAPTILGARAYDRKRWNRGPRVAVLLVVMLGTCSALPGKPTRKATEKEAATKAAVQQGPDAETIEDNFTQRE